MTGHGIAEWFGEPSDHSVAESFRSMLERGCQGACRHFSEKHLQRHVTKRHVAKFAGWRNARPADTPDQTAVLVSGMIGKRLRYRESVT